VRLRWLCGGGYWINPGAGNHDWGYPGWQLQQQLFSRISAGTEVFHTTTQTVGGEPKTRFKIGLIIDGNELQHVLISAGRGLQGSNRFQSYVAYQTY